MKRRFDKRGVLAMEPRAFFDEYELPLRGGRAQLYALQGDVAVVDVSGPLYAEQAYYGESYPAIRESVQAALNDVKVTRVVLAIDSPGGEVNGCFDCARWIAEASSLTGKRIDAFVRGTCCSAAYALACATASITASITACVGSIGVIEIRDDVTAMNATRGLKVNLVTSGEYKADGSPDTTATPEELARAKARVDQYAQVFFDWVQQRRGFDAQPLQAGVFVGAAAKEPKLVDAIGTLDQVITAAMVVAPKETKMSKEEMLGALKAMAEGEEGDEKEWAKKMLGSEEEPKAVVDDKKVDAAAEGDKPKDEDKDEPKAVAAKAAKPATLATVDVKTVFASMLREHKEQEERDALIAQLPEADRADYEGTPIKALRKLVASLSTKTSSKKVVPQTVAATQGGPARNSELVVDVSTPEARKLAAGFGNLSSSNKLCTKYIDGRMYVGVTEDFVPAAKKDVVK